MNIIILGATGMLGQAVCRFFDKKDIEYFPYHKRFSLDGAEGFVSELTNLNPDFIINCIGAIPQKYSQSQPFFELNVALPHFLRSIKNAVYIHPSTDCVFDPYLKKIGEFPGSSDHCDANDLYGFSKGVGDFLVKNPQSVIIRSSIIGLTKDSASGGLLDWAVRKKGEDINGFCNHYWNGVTTDSWIEWVYENIIVQRVSNKSIIHIGSSHWVSKYELLNIINDVFDLRLQIAQLETPEVADRRLSTDYEIGGIHEMLSRTKIFWD